MIVVDIDSVPNGTLVYSLDHVPLGVVRDYLEMNGNKRAKNRRHLDNGKPNDRFAYRREALYETIKRNGPVLIRGASRPRTS